MTLRSRPAGFAAYFGVVVAVLLTTTASAQEKSAAWAQFRGPGGLGVSREKNLPTTWSPSENIAWKVDLPGPGTSSPIIFGERIYLTCYTGYNLPGQNAGSQEDLKRHLLCLNRKDGKLIWNTAVAAKLPEQDRIREGHGYASSTPVADGERIYTFFGKSGAFAFDHNGRQLWQADVGSEIHGWGSAASPVLVGDLVIINASVESESLVALNKKTGKEVWRAEGIKESWNTPLLVALPGGKTEVVVAIQGKVLGFDPASGKQLWSCDTDIRWYMGPSLVAHEGTVYCIGGRSGGGLAVRAGGRGDVTDTHRVWTGNKGSNVSSPIFHEGRLYWVDDASGIVFCADAESGKVLYEKRLERAGQVYASPVLADGKLYYTSRGGRTFVLAAQPTFEQLATNDLGERTMFNAGVAVADGRIYLRSDKSLYCIESR